MNSFNKTGRDGLSGVRVRTVRLTESALMIAAACVLSLIKLVELPAGGSVTLASMLPLVIVAYRHGLPWGMLCGTVFGTVQFILGAGVLSYVTSWTAALAVIVLDYVAAFAASGIAGLFRRLPQSVGIPAGCAAVSVIRYVCHVISGATVWAGLSIPTESALLYSLVYNATYMIPETLILCAVGYWLASAVDLSGTSPVRRERTSGRGWLRAAALAAVCAAGIYDVAAVFGVLQGEDGTFDVTGIANAPWGTVCAVTAAAVAVGAVMVLLSRKRK